VREVIDVVGIGLGSLLLVAMFQVLLLVKHLFCKRGATATAGRLEWNNGHRRLPKGTGLPIAAKVERPVIPS
jgi:hypothetical protein